MTTKPTTPETGNTINDLGVFDTHAALELLFSKARPHLSREELTWIASAAPGVAVFHARNLADTMMTIGCMVTSDESKHLADPHSLSKFLFGLSHQMSVIAELADMAEAARGWLRG